MFIFAAIFDKYTLLFCVCCLLWYCSTVTFNHWKKQRIPFKKPMPVFGNVIRLALLRDHYIVVLHELYVFFQDHPFGGFFEMLNPVLLIKNPDLVHDVLVRDFNKFADRGFDFLFPHRELNPLSMNIFFEDGNRWKELRRKMTPMFTGSKLRDMHEQIVTCTAKLNTLIVKSMLNGSTEQDLKILFGRLTLDVMGSCFFGIDCNSLEENEEFRIMAKKAVEPDATRILISLLNKKIRLGLKLADFPKDVTDFFMRVVLGAMQSRRNSGLKRNDFLQLLIEVQNSHSDLEYEEAESQGNTSERFDEIDIVANSFLFFVAGYETSSATLAHCLYEMALNQNIQDNLRAEVREAYEKHDQGLTVEVLREMKYLNAVISETLRKYPAAPYVNRLCVDDYQIPTSDALIKKGTKILIPTWSIHHDERYYVNPELFDPARFTDENKRSIRKGTYLPFSDGPRNCIGSQLAIMEIRTALADAIIRYNFTVSSRTQIPLTFKKGASILSAKNGVWVNITKQQT